MKQCDRCGILMHTEHPYSFINDLGEKIDMKLCNRCAWEVSNGHNPFEDDFNIIMDRKEEDYSYDPINNPRPY